MKTRTKIWSGFVASAAIVFSMSAPAWADQGQAVVGSQAYYQNAQRQLSATDTQADGKSAIAELRVNGGTVYSVTNSKGNNTTSYYTVPVNIASGTRLEIRACTQDLSAGGSKSCGTWKAFTQ